MPFWRTVLVGLLAMARDDLFRAVVKLISGPTLLLPYAGLTLWQQTGDEPTALVYIAVWIPSLLLFIWTGFALDRLYLYFTRSAFLGDRLSKFWEDGVDLQRTRVTNADELFELRNRVKEWRAKVMEFLESEISKSHARFFDKAPLAHSNDFEVEHYDDGHFRLLQVHHGQNAWLRLRAKRYGYD